MYQPPLKCVKEIKTSVRFFLTVLIITEKIVENFETDILTGKDNPLTGKYNMKTINFEHYPGRHCASTGLRNIVNFQNFSWSEALCFGIGAGLGIYYISLKGISPSRMIHTRSADIEKQFFSRIGLNFSWAQFKNATEGEEALCKALDRGMPVILQSDIYHLPYFNTKTHFPGHVITAWGYDRKEKIFYVTDTERAELLPVPFDKMQKARFCNGIFLKIAGNLYSPGRIKPPENLPEIILNAILYNSNSLLKRNNEFQGIPALEKWQRDLASWKDLKDWQWIARFAYQVIEKRGTGGGGFRLIYSEFLEETVEYLPEIASRGLPQRMHEIASAWSGLALSLKSASEKEKPEFREVTKKLDRLKEQEEAYHKEALALE